MKCVGDNHSTRRRLLRSLGVVGVPLTAGCSGEMGSTGGNETADKPERKTEGTERSTRAPSTPIERR